MEKLIENVVKYRTESGLTQEDLAKACGVSLRTVSRWESNLSDISVKNLLDISKATGATISQLLKGIITSA